MTTDLGPSLRAEPMGTMQSSISSLTTYTAKRPETSTGTMQPLFDSLDTYTVASTSFLDIISAEIT